MNAACLGTVGAWPLVGNPTLAGPGWSCETDYAAGHCFQSQYNDRLTGNVLYRTSADQPFFKVVFKYSDGTTSSSQIYPNKSPTSGYRTVTDFFGTIDAVVGGSDRNVFVNPFGDGFWGNVTCAMGGGNSCGMNLISLDHWRSGYAGQDQASFESVGLGADSSVAPDDRGRLVVNHSSEERLFTVLACSYRLVVSNGEPPVMAPTDGTVTLGPWQAAILERACP